MPRRRRHFGWSPHQHESVLMEAVDAARQTLSSAENAFAAGDCQTAVAHWVISKEEISKAAQHLASFFPRYAVPTGKRRLRNPAVGKTVLDLLKEAGELQSKIMNTCIVRRPPESQGSPRLRPIRGGLGALYSAALGRGTRCAAPKRRRRR